MSRKKLANAAILIGAGTAMRYAPTVAATLAFGGHMIQSIMFGIVR